MQDKELHKLGKTDLLTIIYEQEKRIEQLQEQITELNKKLEDRTIAIQEAGSIADASMKLNKIFEMAQQAADDYLKSIKEVNKSSQEYAKIEENITNEEKDIINFENTNDNLLDNNILELDKDIRNINKVEQVGGLILVNKSLMVKKPKLLKRIIVFLIQIFFKILKSFTNAKFKFKEFKSKVSKEKEIRASALKLKKKEKQYKSKLSPKKQSNALKNVCEKNAKRLKKTLLILKKCDIITPTFGKLQDKVKNKEKNKKKVKDKLKSKEKSKKKVKDKVKGKEKSKKKVTLKLAKKNKFDASKVKISIAALEKELNKRKSKANKVKVLKTITSSIIVIIAFCIIAATQFFNVLQVSGNSMEPNLHTGELLITSKFFKFEKGDMIAFYYNDAVLIKRIIATGGDVVYIDDNGIVYVNSTKLEENYVKELSYGICDITYPYQVPENKVFVLGDNREISIDSRSKSIGCISDEKIIGKIELKLNPFVIY